MSNAKFGDLIEFSYPIGYSHWGVYDEDGDVIHFAVASENHIPTHVTVATALVAFNKNVTSWKFLLCYY